MRKQGIIKRWWVVGIVVIIAYGASEAIAGSSPLSSHTVHINCKHTNV